MEHRKFNNTFKCVGNFSISENSNEYSSNFYEIVTFITTAGNVYEIFENKLIAMAKNEIEAISEKNVKYFSHAVISITNNNH